MWRLGPPTSGWESRIQPPDTISSMADDESTRFWFNPNSPQAPPRQPKPGELLFEFVRATDRAPMSCELRFHVESFGWEVQFFVRGDFFSGRGAFVTKALAILWAEQERKEYERIQSWP